MLTADVCDAQLKFEELTNKRNIEENFAAVGAVCVWALIVWVWRWRGKGGGGVLLAADAFDLDAQRKIESLPTSVALRRKLQRCSARGGGTHAMKSAGSMLACCWCAVAQKELHGRQLVLCNTGMWGAGQPAERLVLASAPLCSVIVPTACCLLLVGVAGAGAHPRGFWQCRDALCGHGGERQLQAQVSMLAFCYCFGLLCARACRQVSAQRGSYIRAALACPGDDGCSHSLCGYLCAVNHPDTHPSCTVLCCAVVCCPDQWCSSQGLC